MQLDREERKEAQRRIDRSAKFQRVLSGEEGEYILKEIDVNTGYKNNTFDPDPYINAYKAGQRSISVFIHNILEQDTKQAIKLLEESEMKNEM